VLLGLAVVVGISGCVSGLLYALIARGIGANQDKNLTARADTARAALATAPAAAFDRTPPAAPLDPATSDDIFVIVLSPDGAPISWTGGRDPSLPAAALTAPGGNATVSIDGVQVRVHVEPWTRTDLDRSGYVAAAQALHSRKSSLAGVIAVIVASGVVTLIAGGVAIWLVSRRLQAAHRRTAEALSGQRRFTADASHELRTPLTTILNNAGFLRANPDAATADRVAAVTDIEAEAQRMSRLVGDLMTLARADGGATLAPAPVDVGALAHEVCRQATARHPDRTLHCAGAPVTVRGDADALTQLLWILLDNAVRHTAEGGNIWVSVASRGPHAATLQVADDGEGIPPGAEKRIFDRFYQADPARGSGGAGLGLSIAQWVAQSHRGGITAATNDRGGATFTVAISSIS